MGMVNKWQASWEQFKKRMPPGKVVVGNVFRVEPFGVFVDIDEEFHAIILVPHLQNEARLEIDDYPKIGDVVESVVLGLSDDTEKEFSYVSVKLLRNLTDGKQK